MTVNRIRLERDLTYDRLAEAMGLNPKTVYRILTTPNARVHDRTLFKIQQFLARQDKKGAAA